MYKVVNIPAKTVPPKKTPPNHKGSDEVSSSSLDATATIKGILIR